MSKGHQTRPSPPLPSDPWQVGYAEIDITPESGLGLLSGFARPRIARSALRPLMCQAIALTDANGTTGVIVCADIIAFDRTSVELLRRRAVDLYQLPPASLLLSASHTHWGPAVSIRANQTTGGVDPWYLHQLEENIAKLIGQALDNRGPASVSYTSLETKIGANRRTFDEKGNQLWMPNEAGSYDSHTPVLRFRMKKASSRSAPTDILLVSHACHPTSSGRVDSFTPDYPGHLRDAISRSLGPQTRTMFAMGCGADAKVTHLDSATGKPVFSADPKQSRNAGQRLAKAVLRHLRDGVATPLKAELACATAAGQFTLEKHKTPREIQAIAYQPTTDLHRAWWARQMLETPDTRKACRYEATAWKLGGALTVLALESEVCSPLGPMARRLARTPMAMSVAYTNCTETYIPSRQIRIEGGYEGVDSYISCQLPAPFTKNVEREFMAIVSDAIRAVERASTTRPPKKMKK